MLDVVRSKLARATVAATLNCVVSIEPHRLPPHANVRAAAPLLQQR
jgi:hypothetical protein